MDNKRRNIRYGTSNLGGNNSKFLVDDTVQYNENTQIKKN